MRSILAAAALVALTACVASPIGLQNAVPRSGYAGTLVVWHNWSKPSSDLLNTYFTRFEEINPQVRIVSEYVDNDHLQERYADQSRAGLGPDLLVGVEPYLLWNIVSQGLAAPIDETSLDVPRFMPEALSAVRYQGRLYGVPFSGYTAVLYYNRKLTSGSRVPATLSDLMTEARIGRTVAVPIGFEFAYWGLSAFGGRLFDDQGQIVLERRVLQDWLSWLATAGNLDNFILGQSDDMQSLYERGKVTYFIGTSTQLPYLRNGLGDDNVGIAQLPRAVAMPAPLLEPEVLVVNASSAHMELALGLIDFLTNAPQQRRLALAEVGRVPMNRTVYVDVGTSESASVLLAAGRNSTIIDTFDNADIVGKAVVLGDDVNNKVVEGLLTSEEGARRLIEGLKEMMRR